MVGGPNASKSPKAGIYMPLVNRREPQRSQQGAHLPIPRGAWKLQYICSFFVLYLLATIRFSEMWMFWHTCVFTDNSFPTSQERLGVDRGEVKDLAQWVLQPALSAVQSNQRAMALLCFACTFLTFLFYSFLIISFVQRRRQRFETLFAKSW